MKIIWTVFKKDLIDILRDRRAIIAMVVIPMVIFPAIFGVFGFFTMKQVKEAQEKVIRLSVVDAGGADELMQRLEAGDGLEVNLEGAIEDPVAWLDEDKADMVLFIGDEFVQTVQGLGSAEVDLYYRSTGDGSILQGRVMKVLREYEDELRDARITALGYGPELMNPIEVNENNLTSTREQIGEAVGGFLPYVFIILCFSGSMYPAIDLGAGEKERGTLETLLTSSSPLSSILIGKMSVVITAGLFSSLLSLGGMLVGVFSMGSMAGKIVEYLGDMVQPLNLLLFFSLLIPLSVFFGAFLLSLSFFAKSFKEAQSIISPLVALIIFPLIFGLLPWVKLSMATAWVPILNISLASKAITSGTVELMPLLSVYVSLFLLSGISLFVAYRLLQRESILFRS